MDNLIEALDQLPQSEQRLVLAGLIKRFVGAVPVEMPPYTLALPLVSDAPVAPGCSVTVSSPAYLPMRMKKLVIAEGEWLQSLQRETVKTSGAWWWKKTTRTFNTEFTSRTVPRSSWEVLSVLVGQQLVYPTYGKMGGDLFAPDSALGMDVVIDPALMFTVSARNVGPTGARFWAAVLGYSAKVAR